MFGKLYGANWVMFRLRVWFKCKCDADIEIHGYDELGVMSMVSMGVPVLGPRLRLELGVSLGVLGVKVYI